MLRSPEAGDRARARRVEGDVAHLDRFREQRPVAQLDCEALEGDDRYLPRFRQLHAGGGWRRRRRVGLRSGCGWRCERGGRFDCAGGWLGCAGGWLGGAGGRLSCGGGRLGYAGGRLRLCGRGLSVRCGRVVLRRRRRFIARVCVGRGCRRRYDGAAIGDWVDGDIIEGDAALPQRQVDVADLNPCVQRVRCLRRNHAAQDDRQRDTHGDDQDDGGDPPPPALQALAPRCRRFLHGVSMRSMFTIAARDRS